MDVTSCFFGGDDEKKTCRSEHESQNIGYIWLVCECVYNIKCIFNMFRTYMIGWFLRPKCNYRKYILIPHSGRYIGFATLQQKKYKKNYSMWFCCHIGGMTNWTVFEKNENMIFFEHHTNFEQHANVGSLGSRSKDQIYEIHQDLATVGGSGQVQKHSKAKSRKNPSFFARIVKIMRQSTLTIYHVQYVHIFFQSLVQEKTKVTPI